MKRIGVALVPLAALLFTFGCDKGKDKEKEKSGAKADAELILGTWKAVSVEDDGKKEPEEKLKQVTIVIGSKDMTFKVNVGEGKDIEMKQTYKLDSTKTPKQIDIEQVVGVEIKDGKKTEKTETKLGIYELDGDTLKVSTPSATGGARPTEITAKEGSKQKLVVLKRVS